MAQPRKPKGAPNGAGGQWDTGTGAAAATLPPVPPSLNHAHAGMDFTGYDMRHIRIDDSDMDDTDMPGADLTGACLNHSRLRRANMDDTDLTGARIYGTDLRGATFMHAAATGLECEDAVMRDTAWAGADLSGMSDTDGDWRGADLEDTTLRGSRLHGTDLRGAAVTGGDWTGMTIDIACTMRDATFTRTDLRGTFDRPGGVLDESVRLDRALIGSRTSWAQISRRDGWEHAVLTSAAHPEPLTADMTCTPQAAWRTAWHDRGRMRAWLDGFTARDGHRPSPKVRDRLSRLLDAHTDPDTGCWAHTDIPAGPDTLDRDCWEETVRRMEHM